MICHNMTKELARLVNRITAVANQSKPMAPAVFLGNWGDSRSPFLLYNLTEAIPGHSEGSTVSDSTLERLGYRLP